jgi:stage II sporulation protein D
VFVVNGRGWGHGVGLSQCGAQGFATAEGWSYDRILAYYYPGTTLGPAPAAKVRVLVAEARQSVTISSASPFTATDGSGRSFSLPAGRVTLGTSLVLDVGGKPEPVVAPVRFEPGAGPLELGKAYRGDIVVHATEKTVWAVNEVGLEAYLYGVVSGEMPAFWAPEALKAQAVAARSYALANRRSRGSFDLYADVRSQVYGGIASEDSRTSAAVDATAGEVVLAPDGAVASTFFFASSGGRTAAARDVWGQDLPYLVSVEDPHDGVCETVHRWGPLVFKPRNLRKALGGPARLRDVLVERDESRRARTVTLVGLARSATFTGADVRRLLELRSTFFEVGVLTLDPVGVAVFGRKVELRGIARGLEGMTLERRTADGAWEPAGELSRADDGSFALVQRLREETRFRLVAAGIAGPAVRVPVAARIVLAPPTGRKRLTGVVRPKLPDATVAVQRLEGETWTTVAEAQTRGDGSFRAKLTLAPGLYRAVVDLGNGLLPGESEPLEVA